MAGETPITVIGNLTADPELRFTPGGDAVANFTVASTPRTFDKTTNDWKDGDTLFMRCSLWREAGENASATLTRGMRVIATGRLVSRSWQTPEGENRTVMEMQVDEVGPSLKYATAVVTKTPKKDGGGSSGGWGGQPQGGQQQRPPAQPQQPRPAQPAAEPDPWAAGGQSSGGWGGAPTYDEPPF